MKIGDLVMKVKTSLARDTAGLGVVLDITYMSPAATRGNPRGYKVQWSNNYGTFWAAEDRLELLNENR
mgnify:CR=1 FL=1